MLWRQWRRGVTDCELFATLQALVAAKDFFDRYNRRLGGLRSILGAHPARLVAMYLEGIPAFAGFRRASRYLARAYAVPVYLDVA